MPEAEARIKSLQDTCAECVENIEDDNKNYEKMEKDLNAKIEELRKNIKNVHEITTEEPRLIDNAQKEHERTIINFELQYKDIVSKSDKLTAENVELEEKSNRIDQTAKEQNYSDQAKIDELKKQIEEIKKMTKDVIEVMEDQEKLEA